MITRTAIFLLLLPVFLLYSNASIAEASAPPATLADRYIARAHELGLAESRGWQTLLLMAPGTLHAPASQAITPNFFLAPQGKYQPAEELAATLQGIFSPTLNEQHAQCRFPARTQWLSEKLNIAPENLPHPECKSFNEFFAEANPAGATLVFPVAYLNSPSSMFGHTFLRIDKVGQTENTRLVAQSINYAASPNTQDGEIVFAWKGVFGGYPGNFSILPYYLKVKEYRDWESRDVWEFKLNLTEAETRQLVRHVWELKDVQFDYYFLKENCSYRTLELLDAVRPDTHLHDQFAHWAIPVDTVRAVEAAGMVQSREFRPSAMQLVRNGLDQLSAEEQAQVLALAETKTDTPAWQHWVATLQSKPIERQQAVLETAYEYLRLKVQIDKLTREETAEQSLALLKMRSALASGSPLTAPALPAVRDDQAHQTSRYSFRAGQADNFNFVELGWRPAFHTLTDPFEGFPTGAQIKFLDTTLRAWEKDAEDSVELERLDLINVTALTRYDRFFQPWSWQANVGARRQQAPEENGERPLVGHFDLSGGINFNLFDSLSSYALLGGASSFLLPDHAGIHGGPSAEIGLFGHYAPEWMRYSGQWQLSAKQIDWRGEDEASQKILEFTHAFNLTRNFTVQLNAHREFRFERWSSEASIGFSVFQ